jgi:hypothetical protein
MYLTAGLDCPALDAYEIVYEHTYLYITMAGSCVSTLIASKNYRQSLVRSRYHHSRGDGLRPRA